MAPAPTPVPDGQSALTRRAMLGLTSRSLLALGLGAGGLSRPARAQAAQPLRFLVANDLHCRDERCHPWLARVAESMQHHRPDFCFLNGDLSEDGTEAQLGDVKRIFANIQAPLHVTIGNHDCLSDTDRSPFEKVFPGSINYRFQHGGWQFIALDSTQGEHVVLTHIQPATLAWLDQTLPTMDPAQPTLLFTHFPMGENVLTRPLNAEDLLRRFDGLNLRAVFDGHWHGYAEHRRRDAVITNSRCCSWWRPNNDKSPEKGYFLCEAFPDGRVTREFCVLATM